MADYAMKTLLKCSSFPWYPKQVLILLKRLIHHCICDENILLRTAKGLNTRFKYNAIRTKI